MRVATNLIWLPVADGENANYVLVECCLKTALVVYNMGDQCNFHFNGSVGPLKSIFMAPLALFNEGVPAHFFCLMEVPTMRLPNIKMFFR